VRTPRHVLIAAALIGLTACGAQAPAGVARNDAGNPAVQGVSGEPAQQLLSFGGQYRFADGLTMSVSPPKPFQPSSSAYPRSDRAAAFEVTVRNDGAQPYRLSGLGISATVDGDMAKQLVDPTQGYSGIVDAGKDVPSGRDASFTLAFAIANAPAAMRLSLRPTATSPVVAVYCGSV
jgi:hypothetical protein